MGVLWLAAPFGGFLLEGAGVEVEVHGQIRRLHGPERLSIRERSAVTSVEFPGPPLLR